MITLNRRDTENTEETSTLTLPRTQGRELHVIFGLEVGKDE